MVLWNSPPCDTAQGYQLCPPLVATSRPSRSVILIPAHCSILLPTTTGFSQAPRPRSAITSPLQAVPPRRLHSRSKGSRSHHQRNSYAANTRSSPYSDCSGNSHQSCQSAWSATRAACKATSLRPRRRWRRFSAGVAIARQRRTSGRWPTTSIRLRKRQSHAYGSNRDPSERNACLWGGLDVTRRGVTEGNDLRYSHSRFPHFP